MSTPNQPGWGEQQGQPYGPPAGGEPTAQHPYGDPYGAPAYGQAPYGQAPYGQQPYGVPPTRRNGLGTSALILGIIAAALAFLIGWTVVLTVIPITLGVVALVQGILGSRRAGRGEATNRGAARAGVVLGVIALVISILSGTLVAVFAGPRIIDYTHCMNRANGNVREERICDRQLGRDFGSGDTVQARLDQPAEPAALTAGR